MDFPRFCLWAAFLVFLSSCGGVRAGDIVHDDDLAPKKPGCENDFVLVNYVIASFLAYLLDIYCGISLGVLFNLWFKVRKGLIVMIHVLVFDLCVCMWKWIGVCDFDVILVVIELNFSSVCLFFMALINLDLNLSLLSSSSPPPLYIMFVFYMY